MTAFAAVATTATGLFAGAAAYVTLVEHPARMACGAEVALREWAPSYKRGTWMQASLAAVASLAGGTAWFLGLGSAWLVGAILQALVIPFTLVVIFPTNDRLLRATKESSLVGVEALLSRWGRLHVVRTLFGCAAFLVFVSAG